MLHGTGRFTARRGYRRSCGWLNARSRPRRRIMRDGPALLRGTGRRRWLRAAPGRRERGHGEEIEEVDGGHVARVREGGVG